MYSLDLRKRVVNFVRSDGSKAETARRYEVSEATVYSWLNRPDLRPTIVTRRRRKLDWQAVTEHVKQREFGIRKKKEKVHIVEVNKQSTTFSHDQSRTFVLCC
ncbi:IS630 transposase-related protein [[Leptolyngbya] sp. PCC 7376]|uniref:IS630 transposase-related protein n=1 Tax=[Leptolyngbya] sp. PCC 7376 TaxID=111781 RepID=UPI00090065C1|nr:IS630 transposase-related protein [[Leptolyngbya] sp. PCC 7376]